MSYDRKIDFVCPHEVVEEALFLSNDRQTVKPLRPIVSAASLRLRLNGIDEVPSAGIATFAEATSTKRGPFNVLAADSQLVIRVNGGAPQTIQIPVGQRLTSAQVALALNTRISGVDVGVTPKGSIRIRTQLRGEAATLMILSQGSALATVLGLPVDRMYRGKTTMSGWSLIKDPGTVARGRRVVFFDQPLKGYRNFVELNYATERSECRRCGGLGVENDWRYNVNGEVIQVRDEALLIQEIQKITFTLQGTNTFHPWYGTKILNAIGSKQSAMGLAQSFIVADLRETFRRWQSIKRQQEQDVGQFVSDEEFPFQIQRVALNPSTTDPTLVFVEAHIQNRSQRGTLKIERGVHLPVPEDIVGSTVQEGLIRQSLQNPVGYDTVGSGSGGPQPDQGQFQGLFNPNQR